MKNRDEEALRYHSEGRPGKIEVVPTKPYSTQHDLALAYSPGVAVPCLEIEKNPQDAYKYTSKGNLVAVISNGTAVLGLGDIGPLAGKPVMEGKGLLFKTFADIDVFDIEVDAKDPEQFIAAVKAISPTFGGINLEDIKAPECFLIEERLKAELDIPVMHDDQHGTAIISAAAMLSAVEITGRKVEKTTVVINGAGAAAISCAKLMMAVGIEKKNIVMCDSKGAVTTSRTDLNAAKKVFATDRKVTGLQDAVKGADLFLGLSVADVLTTEMVQSMAADPIVFALANPDPEISYAKAMASRPDVIFATGRSDYPNQVNNVLGFPYIFRGALDVRATKINEEMKIAAVRALAALAKEPVPEIVSAAYNDCHLTFGRQYLIPKPLDPRLISTVAVAVARAAIDSGVAQKQITDWEGYKFELNRRMGRDDTLLRALRNRAQTSPKKSVVFDFGEHTEVLAAAVRMVSEGIADPILLGNRKNIMKLAKDNHYDLTGCRIVDFTAAEGDELRERYSHMLYNKLSRKGMTHAEVVRKLYVSQWFALMMVDAGDADRAILSYYHRYTKALDIVQQVFCPYDDRTLASMVIVTTKKGPMFFADMGINTSPTVEQLVDIAAMCARTIRGFGVEPVIAMLSHSNFGTDTEPSATKMAKATAILKQKYPDLAVEGEMKADVALNRKFRDEVYPFNSLRGKDVNTFIFPNLPSANISYKIMDYLGGAEINGPILMGIDKGVHLISESAGARELGNLAMIAVTIPSAGENVK